jgi:hypothetical protein
MQIIKIKGAPMSRLSKYLLLTLLVLFVLACNALTQPIQDARNLAETAQSFATAMPIETLRALGTQLPIETLQALPSAAPTLEAFASALPDFGSYFNPEGTPVSVWNEIPVMLQATAGQEFSDTNTYSFKVDSTLEEARNFYDAQLPILGWTSFFNMPADSNGSVQVFQKDNNVLTITIVDTDGSVVVILTLA